MNKASLIMILVGVSALCFALLDFIDYDVRGIVVIVSACILIIAVLIEATERGIWK